MVVGLEGCSNTVVVAAGRVEEGSDGAAGGSLPVRWQRYNSSRREGSIFMVVSVSAVLDHITIYVEGGWERARAWMAAPMFLGGNKPRQLGLACMQLAIKHQLSQ